MTYDFKQLDKNIADAHEWLVKEYKGVRTGRATPAILDGVSVDMYGTRVPLNQSANIGSEDARTLRVSPYDVSQTKAIEKAISDADLGVGVSSDDSGVRVTFPELTSERREQLRKVAKDKLEEARQTLRHARDETWSDIQVQEKNGDMSEDEKFATKDEMQKKIDNAQKELDDILKRKEEEISS